MDGVLRDVIAKVIRLAIFKACFDPSPCHPKGKAPAVVIPPGTGMPEFALAIDGAPKFTAPHDERFV